MDIDLLSKMVKELILDKDEVSLPGVGTFVAEMVPSVFSDKGYTINPPYKRLSFRQKGTGDDSLLIGFYAKCNNLDIETASRIIREFLHEMRHVLETRKSIVFPGLGKLRATRENYFFFVADEDLDIYPEGFGLEPISLKTHEETPAEVSATMAALRGILNPEETAAGEVNVNVAPDSVHDFVTSEANAAVKINIPVREVPVSGPAVASSVETEVPSEEPGIAVDVAAENSDTENVDTGAYTAETSGTESGSDVNAGLESEPDSAADDSEAVASDVNEMASSAAKIEASAAESCSELGSDSLAAEGEDASSGVESSGAVNNSDVNAGAGSVSDHSAEVGEDASSEVGSSGTVNNSDVNAGAGSDMGTSGSQVNASGETSASDIIDKESGVDSFESADKAIDNERSGEGLDSAVQHDEAVSAGEKVSDVVAGDGVGDASVPGTAESPAAGQKADTGSNVVSVECLDTAVDVVDGQVHVAESPAAGQKVEESAVAEDAAMAAKVEESAGAVVAETGGAAASGSGMPGTAQGNADNGSSESASPVAKPASDKSDRVIKTMSGRFSKKKPNWRKVLKWSCIGAVLLALTMLLAFIALAHIAPDFIDSILYSPDELRIINY